MYFAATTSAHGQELWRINLASGIAELFADLTPGDSSTNIRSLQALGSGFVFSVGAELWYSTGAIGSATRLRDFTMMSAVNDLQFLTAIGGRALFAIETDSLGNELWATDGTVAGTSVVRDHAPGSNSTIVTLMGALNQQVIVSLQPLGGTEEIWRTDGTPANSQRLDPSPSNNIGPGALIFFANSDSTSLWRVDVTTGASQSSRVVAQLPIGQPGAPRIGGRFIVRGYTTD